MMILVGVNAAAGFTCFRGVLFYIIATHVFAVVLL